MEAGIPFRAERYRKSSFAGAGGYDAIKDALNEEHTLPTAIFTGSDSIASGVLRYLYENRLMVPDDISVATYDDSILTEYGTPPITSVNINKEQIGIEGYRVLLNRIENPDSERNFVIVPYKIIERGSVKKI
jgi:LacI family transcriptional regulator/LacI family purine nucleotide synthesis repressor